MVIPRMALGQVGKGFSYHRMCSLTLECVLVYYVFLCMALGQVGKGWELMVRVGHRMCSLVMCSLTIECVLLWS